MTNKLEEMNSQLHFELSEWLGSDIPEEGSEDYETWQSRANEIDDIKSYGDVYQYLRWEDEKAEEFFGMFGIDDFRTVI